jgi:PHD/YefM family antitoxin component YafN of YafNO toxin-antitoxin module
VKTIGAAEARVRFETVLDESQRAPVVIRDQDRDVAVVLSIVEYERLRGGAVQAFLDLRNEVAHEAGAAGLTQERLSDLLDDE